MTLEEKLLEAAKRGLTHLSLHPVFSADRKTTYWNCAATPSSTSRYVSAQALDPVTAITQAIDALPRATSRVAKITAAVAELPIPAPEPKPGTLSHWMEP